MGLRRLRVCLSHYLLTACKCVHQAKNVQMLLKLYGIDLSLCPMLRLLCMSGKVLLTRSSSALVFLVDSLCVVSPLKSVSGNPKVLLQMISMSETLRQAGRVFFQFQLICIACFKIHKAALQKEETEGKGKAE